MFINKQILPSTSQCNVGNKYPDEFILSRGSFPISNQNEWVNARFSPHPNQEHLFAMGSENGLIGLCDVKRSYDERKFIKKVMRSSQSVVFDFCYIPSMENWLVSVSGNSRLDLWDIEKGTSILLYGHSNSVRCATVWPDNPFHLVSGARDGSILCWDLRTPPSRKLVKEGSLRYINSYRTYPETHGGSFSVSTPTKKIQQRNPYSITGLLHLGEHHVISASSNSSSGIRIWDLRYQIASSPIRVFTVPQMNKESGITSLCWDRFHSSFFAVCTDNSIYEYMPSVNTELPGLYLTIVIQL